MKKKTVIFYSEAFKLEVVNHYESNRLTMQETSKMFGITGSETLKNWLRKYGKSSSLNKVIRVEKPDEKKRLKELELEVKKHLPTLIYEKLQLRVLLRLLQK